MLRAFNNFRRIQLGNTWRVTWRVHQPQRSSGKGANNCAAGHGPHSMWNNDCWFGAKHIKNESFHNFTKSSTLHPHQSRHFRTAALFQAPRLYQSTNRTPKSEARLRSAYTAQEQLSYHFTNRYALAMKSAFVRSCAFTVPPSKQSLQMHAKLVH